MKKIFIITHNLNGGGAERVACDVANGLAHRGWEVYLFANDNGKETYYINTSVKIIWLNTNSNNRIINGIKVFKQIIESINKFKPSIIVEMLHVYPHEILLASKLAKWKCPIIISEHDSFERPKSAPFSFYQKYKKFFLDSFYDYITVLTKADQRYLSERYRKIEVKYNPLTLEPATNIEEKENVILAVGRIDAWHYKGFDILIKAWNLIEKKYPNWKLKIIGNGSKENIDFLKSLASNKDSMKIEEFTNHIKEEYRKAEIFCLSSRYEAWGLVMVEALSQGCAVIACDYKGRQEECIKDSEDGLICTPENIEKLSSKIELLINDTKLRRKLQVNGIIKSQKFNKENVVNDWDNFLTNLIKC